MSIFEDNVRETWPDVADTILGLVRGTIDPLSFPRTKAWNDEEVLTVNDLIMSAISEVLGGDGVDYIEPRDWNKNGSDNERINDLISYINMGSGYDMTILCDSDTGLFCADAWYVYLEDYNAMCDECNGLGYTTGIGDRHIDCNHCHRTGIRRMAVGERWRVYPS